MQILADPVHATSVPVSSSELFLSNLEHLAFLVSSIHLDFRCFLPHLLQGSLKPKRKDLIEASHLQMSIPRFFYLCLRSGCVSQYFFPYTAIGSFIDDGQIRHWSMSIAERHYNATFSFLKTTITWVYAMSLGYLVSGSCSPSSVGCEFHLVK